MAAKANIATAKAAYEGFGKGDIDSFTKGFHPEAFMIEPDGLLAGGTYRGPKAIAEGIKLAASVMKMVHFELEDIAASESGKLVYAYMHAVMKHQPTGRVIAYPIVEVFRFNEQGQVVEFRPFHFDTARSAGLSAST